MPVTYNDIAVQAAKLVGALDGRTGTVAAEAAFVAALSTTTVITPDFVPSFIQAALLGAVTHSIQTICESRNHPERADFLRDTAQLASGDPLPSTSASGVQLVGVMGRVRDADETAPYTLMQVSTDRVRQYNQFKNSVYRDSNLYLFAIDEAGTIEHTRDNVIIEWPAFVRPAVYAASDPIPLRDWHERGLVWSTVALIAAEEDAYAGVKLAADAERAMYIAQIKSFGAAEGQPIIQKAVASR